MTALQIIETVGLVAGAIGFAAVVMALVTGLPARIAAAR
jgi:hypothetical protein